MILAGVLLKLGAYGFLRLILPLYPAEAKYFAGALAFLAASMSTHDNSARGSLAAVASTTSYTASVTDMSVNPPATVTVGTIAASPDSELGDSSVQWRSA